MQSKPLMIISLAVSPEKAGEFNAFYHHRFLPGILASSPQVESIKRYEEMDTRGVVKLQTKQYLTLYEMRDETSLKNSDTIFQQEGMRDLVTEFQAWKSNDLRNFSRLSFKPGWTHVKPGAEIPFSGRPLILWSVETKPEHDEEFNSWYESEYLPLQIADVPGWCAVRRYETEGSSPKRWLTFFESPDESALERSVNDQQALHRINLNRQWKRLVDTHTCWHEVASYRCIYSRSQGDFK